MAKIRAGFVSNSSSSSFVVAFPKDMEMTKETIKKHLFGEREVIAYYDHGATTERAAEVILADIQAQKPNRTKKLLEALDGWLAGSPDYDDFRIKEDGKKKHQLDIDWDAYTAACEEHKKKVLAEFKAKIGKGMNIYSFEYSDNDGSFYCAMEHGGVFDAAPHIQVSRH